MANKKNLFESNPKKSLFFLFLVIIGLVFITEKILSRSNIIVDCESKRYIRLRELPPLLKGFFRDNDINAENSKFQIKNILFRTDKDGFIMPSMIHEDPDLVIVFFGGSTTACVSVDEKNRFPYLVGRIIEKDTGLNVNSYNSGVVGNNSLHSINIFLNKVIPLQPHIAVMMHNINDLNLLLHEKTYWNKNIYRSPIFELKTIDYLRKIKDLTIPHLYCRLNQILHLNITAKVGEDDEFIFSRGKRLIIDKEYLINEFKMNLQIFIDVSKIRNITPVLMTQQNLMSTDNPAMSDLLKKLKNQGLTYEAYKEIYDLFNQAIRVVGATNNILVVDLDKKIPKEKRYIYDYVHFNDNGSRLAAKLISEDLKSLIRIQNR